MREVWGRVVNLTGIRKPVRRSIHSWHATASEYQQVWKWPINRLAPKNYHTALRSTRSALNWQAVSLSNRLDKLPFKKKLINIQYIVVWVIPKSIDDGVLWSSSINLNAISDPVLNIKSEKTILWTTGGISNPYPWFWFCLFFLSFRKWNVEDIDEWIMSSELSSFISIASVQGCSNQKKGLEQIANGYLFLWVYFTIPFSMLYHYGYLCPVDNFSCWAMGSCKKKWLSKGNTLSLTVCIHTTYYHKSSHAKADKAWWKGTLYVRQKRKLWSVQLNARYDEHKHQPLQLLVRVVIDRACPVLLNESNLEFLLSSSSCSKQRGVGWHGEYMSNSNNKSLRIWAWDMIPYIRPEAVSWTWLKCAILRENLQEGKDKLKEVPFDSRSR